MSIETIKKLSGLNALSSDEGSVFEFLNQELVTLGGEISRDNLGSLICEFDSKIAGPTVAVVAHMDEVGLVVTEINDNGLLKFMASGGLRTDVLISQQVLVKTAFDDTLAGVVLAPSKHSNHKDTLTIDELVIDIGFDDRKSVLEAGVNVGSVVYFVNNFQQIGPDKIMGKALDNRLGCALILDLAKYYQANLKVGKVLLCASVQEEVGLRGAETIFDNTKHDIDIILVVDVSPIDDAFTKSVCKIGQGPLVRIRDPRMIFNYHEINRIRNLAKNHDIKYQEYFSKGGTDAAALQIANNGYVVAAICVGARNIHTPNSIASVKDYTNTVKLATIYVDEILGNK